MLQNVEREAAEILLDAGVSLPLFKIRIPFLQPWTWRITMRRPCLGNQIRIAREYLSLETTFAQMERFTPDEQMTFLARHGVRLSRMVALTICRGWISGRVTAPLLAWFIRWQMPRLMLLTAQVRFISLLGTRDFLPIISSTEKTNPLRPTLSQKRRRS